MDRGIVYEAEPMPDPFREEGEALAIRRSRRENRLLRRGKVKDIYVEDGHLLLVHTDRVSTFDVVLNTLIPYKGVYLCLLSAYWFRKSASIFPNHFMEQIGERILRVVRAERTDIEWIVRGYLYGSAWRAYSRGLRVISGVRLPEGLTLAEKLPEPILTPTTKSDSGHDEEVSKEETVSRGLVSRDEWSELEEACFKLYEFYTYEALKAGVIIADVKLEFGRFKGGLIQIDEPPTHDSARIWSAKYYRPGRRQESFCLDKEFLRTYLARTWDRRGGQPPTLPWPVIRQVALRVRGPTR